MYPNRASIVGTRVPLLLRSPLPSSSALALVLDYVPSYHIIPQIRKCAAGTNLARTLSKVLVTKLTGTIRITPRSGSEKLGPHFEVVFVPYHGRVNAQTVRVTTHDDLVKFLVEIKLSEDEASRWAGRARSDVVLIPSIERTEAQLRDSGLL